MIKVAICQPLVPAYRIPVFEDIAKTDDIELVLYAGQGNGSLRAINQGQNFRVKQANVREIGMLGRVVKLQWGQIAAVRSGRHDVVVFPWDIGYFTLMPALILARRRGIYTILWGHGYSKRSSRFLDIIRSMIGKRADAVLLYSKKMANRQITDFGFSKDRVYVAPNTLDNQPIQKAIQYWKSRADRLDEFRRSHSIDVSKTVVFVSRLEPENRTDMLLHALHISLNKIPGIKLIVIGDGSDRTRLKNLTEELGLSQHVIFAGAIYDERVIAPWMLSATFFCYPINIGLSLLHAYNYSLPVVTSDAIMQHGPEIEAFQDKTNGLFYRHGCIEDMANKWLCIFQNPSLRQSLSVGARQTANQYTINSMVSGFLCAVRSVVT